MTGHAGEFPNCRCYTEPVIPRMDGTTRAYYKGLSTQEEEKQSGVRLFKSQWEKTIASKKENTVPIIPYQSGDTLFNVEKAYFEPKKLTDYSMNFDNEKGKHKAKAWQEILGLTVKDAPNIENLVMSILPGLPAKRKEESLEFGEKFNVMIPMSGPTGRTVEVLTAWMYDRLKDGSGFSTIPRLTTIYISKKKKNV